MFTKSLKSKGNDSGDSDMGMPCDGAVSASMVTDPEKESILQEILQDILQEEWRVPATELRG